MLVNEYKLYIRFNSKKFEKRNIWAFVYTWGSPFVIGRTDAQNGVEIIFN